MLLLRSVCYRFSSWPPEDSRLGRLAQCCDSCLKILEVRFGPQLTAILQTIPGCRSTGPWLLVRMALTAAPSGRAIAILIPDRLNEGKHLRFPGFSAPIRRGHSRRRSWWHGQFAAAMADRAVRISPLDSAGPIWLAAKA